MKPLRIDKYSVLPLRFSLLLLPLMVLMADCSTEVFIEKRPSVEEELGEATVKFRVAIMNMEQSPVTKAPAECVINDLYVMTFNALGQMTDVPQAAAQDVDDYFVTTLNNSAGASRTVFIVANGAASIADYGTTYGWKELPDASPTMMNHVVANLITNPPLNIAPTGLYITENPKTGAMSGSVEMTNGIHNGLIITAYNSSNSPEPVKLIRATAKVTVATSTTIPNFAIEGASMGNAPRTGYIFPQATTPFTNAPYHYSASASNFVPIVGNISSGQSSDTLYCYENNNITNGSVGDLCVILKATYKTVSGYYRIDLADGVWQNEATTRNPLEIKRNRWYQVMIHKVNDFGYATVGEAMGNRASNLEYSITAYVPQTKKYDDAHDIIENGDYFLGVSNSTLMVYSNDTGSSGDITATVLWNNAPSSVTTHTVTVSGTGLVLKTPLSGSFPTAGGAMAVPLEIEVELTSSFTYATTGEITITLGNLVKKITVIRKPSIPYLSGVLTDFAGSDYVMGVKRRDASGVLPDWIKFSVLPDGSGAIDELTNVTGGIYAVYNHNMALLNLPPAVAPRKAELYFSRRDNNGRVKAHIHQPHLEIDESINDNNPANVTPFVGAFWKGGQVGERLIRFIRPASNPTAVDGQWTAFVAEGDEWIVVDRTPSANATVWSMGYSGLDGNDIGFDLAHTVTGMSYTFGTANGAMTPLHFRIGLKSAHNPTSNVPARYGLVVLVYGDGAYRQRIWIRQGEGADYLMRPEDSGGGGPWGSPNPRPNAVRLVPYNLSAATLDAQADISGANPKVNPGIFANYPTQTGAYFQFSEQTYPRYAYAPHTLAPAMWATHYPSGFYWTGVGNLSATYETCPQGYRRIDDGSTSVSVPSNSDFEGYVTGSEIRQSLWLNPPTTSSSNVVNSAWGYYADGFFDRREIGNGPIGATNPGTNSSVSVGSRDIAHLGRIFFNLNNKASLFFPASGYRASSGGTLTDPGTMLRYSTSSKWGDNSVSFYGYFDMACVVISALSTGHTIRCVLNPPPPMNSP